MLLPADAREEYSQLQATGEEPAHAWIADRGDTTFRQQMRPHADRDDEAFRILVPVSGGLDSTTCLHMAAFAGLPLAPVMVDTGVPYARHDQRAAEYVAGAVPGGSLTILDLPATDWHTPDPGGQFQVGRNSAIIWRIMQWAHQHGWWGEVWFGNLANYLETPIIGGDKSHRWALTLQQLAAAHGYDFRIASPLGGMSKADLVTWWAGRNNLPFILATRSCFADTPGQCGRCWACLYRYVAFAARGYADDIAATYPAGIDFTDAAREFWRRARWRLVTTHPARMVEVTAVLDRLGLGADRFPDDTLDVDAR